jgi:hypothetical protein
MKPTTTVAKFVAEIADLPLRIVETNACSLVVMPAVPTPDNHLFRALQTRCDRRGVKVRKGCAVWTVKGFNR